MMDMCRQQGWRTLEVLLSDMVPRSLWEAVQFLAFCMSRTTFEPLSENTLFYALTASCLLRPVRSDRTSMYTTGILHAVYHARFQ